jgi:hypothetical protein
VTEPFTPPAAPARVPATAEERLRRFQLRNPDVVRLLQCRGIAPADLGV